jgi:hypothetical protein
MRQRRKLLWSPQLVLELEQARGLVLEQVLPLELDLELELELEPVLGQELVQVLVPKRRRNPSRLLQVSSRHRASTSQYRFSRRRQRHCASCQRFGRRLRLRELRWQPTSPIY